MPPFVQSIEGIAPCQVYQRDAKGFARIAFRGSLSKAAEGIVEARVTKGAEAILDWKSVGKASGESFSGEIAGVPTGGEYTVELRFPTAATFAVPRVMVGDLWILAGQSNMDGCGKLVNLEPPSKQVHCFYMDDTWEIARDPLVDLNGSVDEVHWGFEPGKREEAIRFDRYFKTAGAGLGVRFGKEMVKHTGIPIGLIPCSHGGTSMEQWNPARRDEGGKSLYGAMIRRVKALGGKVAGCLWYQGESDSNPDASKVYKQKFRNLIESLRSDLGQPELPFIYAQIGLFFIGDDNDLSWNVIQHEELALEKELKNVAMAATIDLPLSDIIHVDALGMRRLGVRMSRLARALRFGEKLPLGPRPSEFSLDAERTTLTVQFSGVAGALKKIPRVWGFHADGIAVVNSKVDGNCVILQFEKPLPPKTKLQYGYGHAPVATLSDSADMAVPVFGPVEIP